MDQTDAKIRKVCADAFKRIDCRLQLQLVTFFNQRANNKRLLDERQRTSLVKRRLDPQAKESESFEQEAIASEGDLASSDPDEASTVLR